MPEFQRSVLETLRQPLEDGYVTIARAHSSLRFPAEFMLVGAMNPTAKGDMPSDEMSQRQMDRYLSKISGPLIDRIDIHVEVDNVEYVQLTDPQRGTDTQTMREQVLAARVCQSNRNANRTNSVLSGRELDRLAVIDDAGQAVLKQSMAELGLSARAYDKIRRVARTIADLDGSEHIQMEHVAEAVQYRLLDRKT